jgi:hypothetical protein
MARPRETRQHLHRIKPLALAAVILGVAGAIADDSAPLKPNASRWAEVGEPVPVAVNNGVARFSVPTAAKHDRTLVIVSSLARGAKTHDVSLTASAAATWTLPQRTREGLHRSPEVPRTRANPIPPKPARLPPSERTFHLMVRQGDPTSASNYLAVRGVLRGAGERVQVYVDARAREVVSEELLRDIIVTFDSQIFPRAARHWGPARDVDGDGRFTVLLTDWLSRFGGGRLAVEGFVRGADLDPRMSAPFSNHCDMMYLSTALRAGPHLRTILAHEYAHAATFSHKTSLDGRAPRPAGAEEEGWLDEAIAHLVEDAHSFSRSNVDYRVSAFLSNPERYQLVVKDYYTADLFRSHGNRGSTYLFLRWCVDHYGPSLLSTLIQSPRRGVANLEAATGMGFADLYRRWSTDLFMDNLAAKKDTRGTETLASDSQEAGWIAVGPRPSCQAADGTTKHWALTGTSTHYAIVEGSAKGAVSIEVAGSAEADLQVTAIRLPADLPRLELSVVPTAGASDACRVRVQARVVDGGDVELTQLVWEPLVPRGEILDAGNHHGRLDTAGLKKAFGNLTLNGESPRTSDLIPLTGVAPDDGPIVIKLLGTDTKGRRVVGWGVVGAGEESGERR